MKCYSVTVADSDTYTMGRCLGHLDQVLRSLQMNHVGKVRYRSCPRKERNEPFAIKAPQEAIRSIGTKRMVEEQRRFAGRGKPRKLRWFDRLERWGKTSRAWALSPPECHESIKTRLLVFETRSLGTLGTEWIWHYWKRKCPERLENESNQEINWARVQLCPLGKSKAETRHSTWHRVRAEQVSVEFINGGSEVDGEHEVQNLAVCSG